MSESPGKAELSELTGERTFAPFLTLSLFVFLRNTFFGNLFCFACALMLGTLYRCSALYEGKGMVFFNLKLMLYILSAMVNGCLLVIETAMFVRAILSWFIEDDGGALMTFLYAITEPFIYPFRKLLEKLHIGEGIPIDIAFLLAFIVINLLKMIF